MRFEFTSEIHDETGELGWKDSRIRSEIFGPLSYPFGLAHDCIEHFEFESVASEIEAHGAIYRIRYETGWTIFGKSVSLDNLAGEWYSLLNALVSEGYLPDPPRTQRLAEHIEADISTIIEEGRKVCISEFGLNDSDEYTQGTRADLERLASVFRAFFRRGYRKAGQRYKGHDMYNVAQLMGELEKAFQRQSLEFEGQRITVHVSLKDYSVRVEEYSEEEYA